jgi:hypothetical protein
MYAGLVKGSGDDPKYRESSSLIKILSVLIMIYIVGLDNIQLRIICKKYIIINIMKLLPLYIQVELLGPLYWT